MATVGAGGSPLGVECNVQVVVYCSETGHCRRERENRDRDMDRPWLGAGFLCKCWVICVCKCVKVREREREVRESRGRAGGRLFVAHSQVSFLSLGGES